MPHATVVAVVLSRRRGRLGDREFERDCRFFAARSHGLLVHKKLSCSFNESSTISPLEFERQRSTDEQLPRSFRRDSGGQGASGDGVRKLVWAGSSGPSFRPFTEGSCSNSLHVQETQCRRSDLNRHGGCPPPDFESGMSAISSRRRLLRG